MKQKKYLFIDRDGTLIVEPEDQQVDRLDKLNFVDGVIPALCSLKNAGYAFVMVSNQDGLGTKTFLREQFEGPQEMMLRIFRSQGIEFEDVRICPHLPEQQCDCRKPNVGLVLDYLKEQSIDRERSFVIGDRETDLILADNMGIKGLRIGQQGATSWWDIASCILSAPRCSTVTRKTRETAIDATVDLDRPNRIEIHTGIGFFDHMLNLLAKHAGIGLYLNARGDLEVCEHHTVEDCAIILGEALANALGDKYGIARYGYVLPMDESLASIALDLSGRPYLKINGDFRRATVGTFPTELVSHFFRSLACSLGATIHIDVTGEDTHHMIEAIFKAFGRTLRQAINLIDSSVPTTKGVL